MQLPQHEAVVRPEWIDANGHMNLAYYIVVFDHATDVVFDALDIGFRYRQRTGCSSFVVETHTLYEHEVMEGQCVVVATRLLGVDGKRLHLFHEMFLAGAHDRVAAHELMCLNIDLTTRRVVPFPSQQQTTLAAAVAAQRSLKLPKGIGRRIAMGTTGQDLMSP